MASPQVENGYTKIANELLEELIKAPLLGAELAVALFVIRKTYGYGKKEDAISLTQFEATLKRSRPTIVKALKNLQLVKILELVKVGDSKTNSSVWRLNKDYEAWELVNIPQLVKSKNTTSKVIAKQLVKTPKHTKENIQKKYTKEIITKVIKAKPRKELMGVITEQDEKTGEIRTVMRMNSKGELEPAVYGDRNIGLSILAFEEHLGGKTDGTAKSERLYAGHLTKALAKEYPDQDPVELVKWLLKGAMTDPWLSKNCTSFRWLYYNKQKVIQAVKGLKNKETKGIVIS